MEELLHHITGKERRLIAEQLTPNQRTNLELYNIMTEYLNYTELFDDIEPEEKQMLKNIDISKAYDIAKNNRITPGTKTRYTKALINLAAAESDDSASAAYYEKAAVMDSTTRRYSGQIVSGFKNRLNKTECLTKTYTDRIGILGEQANSLRKLYQDAPYDSIPASDRIKFFIFAILAFASAALFMLTPLKDFIYGDDTLFPYILTLAVFGICAVGGLILDGFFGLFIGMVLGSIAGYVAYLAANFFPVIAFIAGLVFFIKAIRPNASRKKEFDKYMEEHEIIDKAADLIADAGIVKNAFTIMDQCEGLDEITAYYDTIIKKAEFYMDSAIR